jgi:hypothetical protein
MFYNAENKYGPYSLDYTQNELKVPTVKITLLLC